MSVNRTGEHSEHTRVKLLIVEESPQEFHIELTGRGTSHVAHSGCFKAILHSLEGTRAQTCRSTVTILLVTGYVRATGCL